MKKPLSKTGMARPKSGMMVVLRDALDDLSVFVSVAEHASFSEASRRTALPTSSVSRAVARLEERLGVPLFRRTSRQVSLTVEGRDLFAEAAPHVQGLEAALTAASERRAEPSGIVRVTAPAYTGATRIAAALAEFSATYPQIQLELDASNTRRDLLDEGFDFAIRTGPAVAADFVTRKLWRGYFGLFATPEFAAQALGTQTGVKREMLEKEPCIVLRRTAEWAFVSARGRRVALKPRLRFAVNDPRGAVEVARKGLGFVLAPLDAVADTGLVRLKTELGEPEPVDLYLVYPTRRLLPQRVRLAIDWLTQARYARRGE